MREPSVEQTRGAVVLQQLVIAFCAFFAGTFSLTGSHALRTDDLLAALG